MVCPAVLLSLMVLLSFMLASYTRILSNLVFLPVRRDHLRVLLRSIDYERSFDAPSTLSLYNGSF